MKKLKLRLHTLKCAWKVKKPSVKRLKTYYPPSVQIEDALRESEERYQTIFNNAGDLVYVTSPDRKIISLNPAFEQITGWSVQDWRGKKSTPLIHPEDRAIADSKLEKFISGEKITPAVLRILTKSGEYRILEFVTTLLKRNGNLVGLLWIGRDITERKRAEEALQKSEEKYRTLFETMAQGVVYQDEGGRIISANSAAERILGLSLDQMVGRTSMDSRWHAIHEDGSEFPGEMHPAMVALRTGQEVRKVVMGIFNPQRDEYYWINVHAVPQFKPGQDPPYQVYTTFDDITDRKRAEDALKRSEEKYRELVENLNDVLYSVDADGTITYISQRVETLFGFSPEEVIGRSYLFLIHPDDHNAIQQAFADYLRERLYPCEFRMRTKGGEYRWMRTCSRPVRAGERIIGLRGLLTDITERKEEEEELRESKNRYRNLFEQSPDGIVIWQDEKAALVNPAAMHMLAAASAGEIIGRSIYSIHVDHHDKLRQRREYIHKAGLLGTPTDYKFIRLDGQTIDVEATGTLINYKNRPAILSFYRDISERRRAEEGLRLSHERFLTVLNSIDAIIFVADMETHEILFMNKYMIESFGRDMTGEICWQALREESGPCAMCTNDRLVDDRGNPTGLYVWQAKNTKTGKWYIHHDRAIHWIDDRLVRIQIATDITEIKNLEEERIGSEKRLRQAHKMEAIGTLASGIAHDFNNILFAIISMSELLLEDLPYGSPERENAQEILKAGKRASDLVKQILAFSRQTALQKIPIRVQHILKEALKLSRSTIPSNIEIAQDVQSDCGLMMTDPAQIHQIVMNLITNAYHATEATGGKIVVTLKEIVLEPDDEVFSSLVPGRYAMLSVSDTGCGIDPAILDKIFEPYFTTKDQSKGTGLGLAVVYGIVKEHHGDIKVLSEIGKGTTFYVYLPLMENSVETASVEKFENNKTGNERILLVDDEEPIVRLERLMLERLGYRVTSRVSSIEALEAFRANPNNFDLVITDMTMPNMTGDQLVGELIAIRPDIPVVICTGFSERINQEKTAEIGIKGFLMKPIVRSEMARMVRKVLDKQVGSA